MKVKALSHYDGDKKTRFGDCILGIGNNKLLVYDCGHEQHAESVQEFLEKQTRISEISIVISHDDADHTNGVTALMDYLSNKDYAVTLYTSLYLKSVDEIQELLDDGRRKKSKTCEHILALFGNIEKIVTAAQEYGFSVVNALPETDVGLGTIVGPTEEEFVPVVAKAIEADGQGIIDGETIMNAASLQVSCMLDDGSVLLLCGDASPEYLHDLDSYDIIQLPHHGQLADAEAIWDKLDDPHVKEYLISDNTGTGHNSGGSDKLTKKMKEDKFSPAHNTKDGVVELPTEKNNSQKSSGKGVRLGVLDCGPRH